MTWPPRSTPTGRPGPASTPSSPPPRASTSPAEGLGADEAPVNLRWVLMHLLEETARHAGHADILRELIDGRTGR